MTNKLKKTIISSVPYAFIGLFATKLGQAWRFTSGDELGERILDLGNGILEAMQSPLPSFYPFDLPQGAVPTEYIKRGGGALPPLSRQKVTR